MEFKVFLIGYFFKLRGVFSLDFKLNIYKKFLGVRNYLFRDVLLIVVITMCEKNFF